MEQNFETVTINGKTYYSSPQESVEYNGEWKIVILQRGWVMVGKLERKGSECKLHRAAVLRRWGTKEGLGELSGGPLDDTKLDKCGGLVEFDWLTVVASISVDGAKWQNVLV